MSMQQGGDERPAGGEALLRQALALAGVGLLREDRADGRIALDATGRALLGLADAPAPDDLRAALLAAIDPQDRDALRAAAAAARRGEALAPVELRLAAAPGRVIRVQFMREPAGGGATPALVGVLQDASGAHRLQAAEQAAQARSAFVARIAHDLRTPLNAILGFCDLLQHSDRHPLAAEPAEQVAYIDRAGRQLRRLIDGLIDMARIDTGQLKVRSGRADLAALAAAAWSDAAARAAQRQVRLAPFDAPPALVAADAARLRQIVDHLVDNAIRYNRDGGSAELGLASRDGGWELTLRDTGMGMTPAQVAAAFEPFPRRAEAAAARGQGLGFGLPIAAHVARAMGGRLAIESVPGAGSTLRLWLPGADAPPRAPS